jgi:hypothetical protein
LKEYCIQLAHPIHHIAYKYAVALAHMLRVKLEKSLSENDFSKLVSIIDSTNYDKLQKSISENDRSNKELFLKLYTKLDTKIDKLGTYTIGIGFLVSGLYFILPAR